MKIFQLVLVLLCCLILGGCGQKLKGLVPCSGVVLKDGQPVEGVNITFIPVSTDPQARGANAVTDVNGNFNVITLQWNGISPGKYKVTLSKRVTEVNPNQESIPDNYKSVTHIEQLGKYADPERSDLTVDIPKSGNKNLKLEIQ
ncbi:MAG: carboxypeptidase-like regulatory domain-containing protein [Planctomycetaceae bacterium]|jgi:hypothetical protein|nr:carboxypeptidase-like regulatory domain-containing protein [Planctomycetaceae bacterium]